MNWLKYRNYWMVWGAMFFLPVMAQGQTGVGLGTMKANVSETVALSVSPNLPQEKVRTDVHGNLQSLTLTLSGSSTEVVVVRVPVLIRSNSFYKISALVQSQAATLSGLAVLGARPTGKLVAMDAVANLNVARDLDSRTPIGPVQTAASWPLNLSPSLTILSGPRVSLGGTLNSADNALEVTLLITVKPEAGTDSWFLRLAFSGSAGDGF